MGAFVGSLVEANVGEFVGNFVGRLEVVLYVGLDLRAIFVSFTRMKLGRAVGLSVELSERAEFGLKFRASVGGEVT